MIGNSGYEHQKLDNPYNDAVDMAELLAEMDFHVIRAINLNNQEMDQVVRDFHQLLADTPAPANEKVGFFYFSGHGARSNRDENYLLPINNSKIRRESDLRQQALKVRTEIMELMEDANKGVNIVIADACRDNPYEGSKARGKPRGLGRETPSPATSEKLGVLIAFGADEGEIADDGDDSNGLYTKHLLAKMREGKHKPIEDVFMEVREPVTQESKDRQHPWYESTLVKDYCLGGCLE